MTRLAHLIEARRLRAAARPFTLNPPAAHAYACARCRCWHREDRDPATYRDHSLYQAGTATYTIPVNPD